MSSDYFSLKAQMIVFLAKNYFLIKVCIFPFRNNAITLLIDCSIE